MMLMAEMRSWRSQAFSTGVWPDGAQVRRRTGWSMKPLSSNKTRGVISGLVDTIAILTSLSLQYGVPVENLAVKFQHTRFEPSGHTINNEIPITSSISDYVFTWLGLRFSADFRETYMVRSSVKKAFNEVQSPYVV